MVVPGIKSVEQCSRYDHFYNVYVSCQMCISTTSTVVCTFLKFNSIKKWKFETNILGLDCFENWYSVNLIKFQPRQFCLKNTKKKVPNEQAD